MFSRGNKFGSFGAGKNRLFGKKDTSSKKHQSRMWIAMNKKRNEQQQQPSTSKNNLGLRDDDDADNAGVMMSADSSPTLQASLPSPNYVDLPDEPRPGKITPTTPATNTTNSSPSPRASKSDDTGGKSSPEVDEEEAIEEAVPIVRTTLPSPEPRPLIERNGYKDHDRVDGINGIKQKPPQQHDVDDDSCLIKCVYFTQQCCECTIV